MRRLLTRVWMAWVPTPAGQSKCFHTAMRSLDGTAWSLWTDTPGNRAD